MYHHSPFGYGAKHAFHSRMSRASYWRRPKYNVPMNIVEKEGVYEAHIYATGFNKDDIRIKVSDNVLHVSGTRTVDEGNLPDFVVQEFPIKNFERHIHLRGKVDASLISARQENSVLIITLPKSAEAQKSEQEIKVD
jgi:HSP20 family protein